MKNTSKIFKALLMTLICGLALTACDQKLDEMNVNPYGIDPTEVNPNLLMPTILAASAQNYASLGVNDLAGAVQHTQKNGWYGGHNTYSWENMSWTGWYDILRNNDLLYNRAVTMESKFFQGVSLTMKSFVFGNITDLWGDAPYTDALKGNENSMDFQFPQFDSQEIIYKGIITDLKAAVQLFENANNTGVVPANDLYFNGNVEKWKRFANSLLLRYYMRISVKMPAEAKAGVEAIYASGDYIKNASHDAALDYTGGASDIWLTRHVKLNPDDFTRYQASQTFLDQLIGTNDPRLTVWFAPVRVQWVADKTLATATDNNIWRNGEPLGVLTLPFDDFVVLYPKDKFTRRYNPDLISLNDALYVGLPPALVIPESYNGNPSPGQGTHNQHVSTLADIYQTAGSTGDILKARLISSAEVSFIFAEAALNGWSVGSAQENYNAGIEKSLASWGQAGKLSKFLAEDGVAFNNTLEQIMVQKWVSSWTAAAESFADYKRTGFPSLAAGPQSPQPRVALRFQYGNDEYNNNSININKAIENLQLTDYSGGFGKDSQWSKSWLYQGTTTPW